MCGGVVWYSVWETNIIVEKPANEHEWNEKSF